MSFTLTTSAAILMKAGSGVSTDLTASAAFLVKMSDIAEGVINAATRKDWVANYSSVSTNFRGILDDTASDIAATELVKWDMSGYTSRLEAQTILDVMRDKIQRNLNVLNDEKHKEVFI